MCAIGHAVFYFVAYLLDVPAGFLFPGFFDSCDEIRTKIRALLDSKQTIAGETDKRGKPKTYTRARFLQDLGNVNTNSLRRFMERDGEMSGAEIGVYYAASVFPLYQLAPSIDIEFSCEKWEKQGA